MIRLTDILNEIGDGNIKPYKFTNYQPYYTGYRLETFAHFTTDSGMKYVVMIDGTKNTKDPEGGVNCALTFGVTGNKGVDFTAITNKGELFRIMATVIDFMKRIIKDKSYKLNMVSFAGERKKGANPKDASKRTKFYMAYVKKHPLLRKHFKPKMQGSNEVWLFTKDNPFPLEKTW